ncbi:MAG: hypothetical protein OK455_10065 [Thaumarchaeota archaeon]|nr:hypothetical protein [Nitrososphaerota archaeon]
MRFFVMEKVKAGVQLGPKDFAKMAGDDLEYKRKLEKAGKIIGGPCLDILAQGFVLETETIEEMGEIFFESPSNLVMDREVHPLGTFKDTLEGMNEMRKK